MDKVTNPRSIIERARHMAGMTQGDVAKALGVSKQTIWRWENVALPHLANLIRLEDLYGEAIIEPLVKQIREGI